jgi:hypothetical protein
MANSGPQLSEAAEVKYVPLAKKAAEAACARRFRPGERCHDCAITPASALMLMRAGSPYG